MAEEQPTEKLEGICEFVDSCPTLETLTRFQRWYKERDSGIHSFYAKIIGNLRHIACNCDYDIQQHKICPQYQHLKKSSRGE